MGDQDAIHVMLAGEVADELAFSQALIQRRSRRNFVKRAVAEKPFWRLLGMIAAGFSRRNPAHYPWGAGLGCGFVVGDKMPLDPGFYRFTHDGCRYGQVLAGTDVGAMASACLEQRWLSAAGLQFVFLSAPARCDRLHGPRGYRYAMLNAGRLGQLVYLGATALGLGACGIGAFFDDEIRSLLDLPGGEAPLYLVAAGAVKSRVM